MKRLLSPALLLAIGLLAPPAAAAPLPYGVPSTDPYTDGYPSADERELHIWTNAVRVDPVAFETAYPCGMGSFSESESTPKDPLYLDMGLAEAARYHTLDMYENDHFSHSSSDGTSFGERTGWFYTDGGNIGENIAWNYPSSYATVIEGWMCSDGHRANIMADFNELGTGVVGPYATQDFGAGDIQTRSPVAMGAHTPVAALSEADFLADWLDDDPPVEFRAIVDGVAHDLELRYGTAARGVYAVTLTLEPADCHGYRFDWEDAAGTTGSFPEAGYYTWGDGCEDTIGWVDDGGSTTFGPGIGYGDSDRPDLGDPRLIGCSTRPGGASGGPAGAGGLLVGTLLILSGLSRRRS